MSRASRRIQRARSVEASRQDGPGVAYYRLHGAPRIYYSEYDAAFLDRLANVLRVAAAHAETWCILDNTARGHATTNAMRLCAALSPQC